MDFHIPKHIASIFRTHNIFEYKGLGSSLTKYTYYKTNAHAGYYINSLSKTSAIDRRDVTLTFPTFHYPRNLFKHLTKECKITIENSFPGVYYINKEMYATQVLVIKELSPEDSMYLYCLKKNLNDLNLINNLTADYALNRNSKLYTSYMNQFFYSHMKGKQFMVCEGLLNYFGTSSEEIAACHHNKITDYCAKSAAAYLVLILRRPPANGFLPNHPQDVICEPPGGRLAHNLSSGAEPLLHRNFKSSLH